MGVGVGWGGGDGDVWLGLGCIRGICQLGVSSF